MSLHMFFSVNFHYFNFQINVDTKEMWNFTFHEDQYPQEPWFLPRPGSTEEDDGVLLVQGFDGRAGKGRIQHNFFQNLFSTGFYAKKIIKCNIGSSLCDLDYLLM